MKRKTWKQKKKFTNDDLPPRNEWGGKSEFKRYKYLKSGDRKPRCQAFSKEKIFEGFRGVDAQCPNTAKIGHKYCHAHLRNKNLDKRKPRTLQQELYRYSKYLPKDFFLRVLDFGQDKDRLSMAQEIDVVTARLSQLFERLDTGESARAWEMVQDAYILIDNGIKTQTTTDLMAGIRLLKRALGSADYRAWNEALNVIQHRKTLVESERRALVERAQIFTIMEVLGMLSKIQADLFDLFPDQKTRTLLSRKFLEWAIPDPSVMPPPDSSVTGVLPTRTRTPKWAMDEDGENAGCVVCQNEEFQRRNADWEGKFTCPNCRKTWTNIVIEHKPGLLEEAEGLDEEESGGKNGKEAP